MPHQRQEVELIFPLGFVFEQLSPTRAHARRAAIEPARVGANMDADAIRLRAGAYFFCCGVLQDDWILRTCLEFTGRLSWRALS